MEQELKMKRKKQLKKDTASKIKLLVDEHKQIYEQSEKFQKKLKLKVREILTDQEWRRRKMAMRLKGSEQQLEVSVSTHRLYGCFTSTSLDPTVDRRDEQRL
ncbi:unnamed protein product [Cochlearia groenlandica]